MKNTYLFVALFFPFLPCFSQSSLSGRVIDRQEQPIDAVSVILQDKDSVFQEAVLTHPDGTFIFTKATFPYRLILQHITYETKIIEGNAPDAGVVIMDEKNNLLTEITVQAQRSFVKVEDGKLGYDLSVLTQNRIVNNAYEALSELPGVREDNGGLSLVGASGVTLMINGKPSSMTAGQLETLLRNTPVDRVAKAEVIYSAPPEYHVRGAVINVVLKRPADYSFQGEVNTEYTNRYFNYGKVGGNFRLSTPKLAWDFMYTAGHYKSLQYIDLLSLHSFQEEIYSINQNQQIRGETWRHQLRNALDYNFNDKNSLTLAYTTTLSPETKGNSMTTGNFQQSRVINEEESRLHNLSLQTRTGIGLDMGMDYTHYRSDQNQVMNSHLADSSALLLTLDGGQKIDRLSIYADRKHALSGGWMMGYGVSYAYVHDKDFQFYTSVEGDRPVTHTDNRLQEHTTDFYFSLSKSYETGTHLSLSATGEHYKIGDYSRWAVYPQATFLYRKSPAHIWQVALSSQKNYPGYWGMQSSISYLDGYSEIHGAPGLKPMSIYDLTGSYIWKGKYVFSLAYNHISDFFTQAVYQSSERLALIYQTKNWNYSEKWQATLVIPVTTSKWWDMRLMAMGFNKKQKADDYFDIPFNRSRWTALLSLNNTFKIGKQFSFNADALYQSPTIQGTYDLESVWIVNLKGRWMFAKERASLSVSCNDLLGKGVPEAVVDFKNQRLNLDTGHYTRSVVVHLSYRFGGYKEKKHKEVDTSRFGH